MQKIRGARLRSPRLSGRRSGLDIILLYVALDGNVPDLRPGDVRAGAVRNARLEDRDRIAIVALGDNHGAIHARDIANVDILTARTLN